MLSEGEKEGLRSATVEMLLEMRAAYLKTAQANALTHWDLLQSRMRSAARTSASVEEWATDMAKSLRLGAPSPRYSEALRTLADLARPEVAVDHGGAFLDLVDAEWGYLIAMARAVAEKRKEESNA
jgi:hypothetical protein